MEHPQIFLGPINLDVPDQLVELAVQAAANREFAAESLARARRLLSTAQAVQTAMEHDTRTAWDEAVIDQMRQMIGNGTAWGEREAQANLSVLDRRVEMKGVEVQIQNAKGRVRELEDVYQAWRDSEWAIDRQVKLMALRHQLGEI
jgi:hypothetical protein